MVAACTWRLDMLTSEQILRYESDGHLAVTDKVLPADEIVYVRDRIDRLFDNWGTLPERLAPGASDDGSPPLLAKIHRVCTVDPGIAHSQLVRTCNEIAAEVLGGHVWCRFDSAIYKHPGAGSVDWHQDYSLSTIGVPKRSVHFWIPLNDHTSNSGTVEFAPGSHHGPFPKDQLVPFEALPAPEPQSNRTATAAAAATATATATAIRTVSVPLSVGNFSIHTPWTWHGSGPNTGGNVRKALLLEYSSSPGSAARQLSRPLFSALLVRQSRARGRG